MPQPSVPDQVALHPCGIERYVPEPDIYAAQSGPSGKYRKLNGTARGTALAQPLTSLGIFEDRPHVEVITRRPIRCTHVAKIPFPNGGRGDYSRACHRGEYGGVQHCE